MCEMWGNVSFPAMYIRHTANSSKLSAVCCLIAGNNNLLECF